ncbi:MAG: magnesium transporter CorA family protein [Gemmatimonadaceae bacterium]|nr:magnesium transporter CorA family protein [Gemmatimonadaceae bacterium]
MPKRGSRTYRLRDSRVVQLTDVERATAESRAIPRSWYRDPSGAVQENIDPREYPAIIAAGTGTLWVDIDLEQGAQVALLEKLFRFHPLAVEDTLSPSGRVKVEEYPGYLFTVVRAVRFMHETNDPYDVETFNLCAFLGVNYLVTVRGRHAPGIDGVMDRVSRSHDLMDRGAARLLHAVLDGTVDAYFPIVDQLDAFVDGIEERVFVTFDAEALRDIFAFKRLVLQLRRHLAPQREVFSVLSNRPSAVLPPDAQLYFRDIYDHVIRLNESLDTYRDLLSSTMDSYLTQVSNRLGAVSKGLAALGAISIPFVVISGMWGMNFQYMPLADDPHGFWWMLGIQLGLGGALIWILRRRGVL